MFTCQAPPAPAKTTRLDQLQMKAKTKATDDTGEEKAPKGRGRGKGKGRGRGRGGQGKGNQVKQDPEGTEAEPSAPPEKRKRTPKGKHKEEDWAAWGTDGAWAQGWGDDDWDEEGWAWDSLAWWDSQCTTAELGQPDHKKAKTNKSRKASTTQAADASTGEHTKEEDKVKDGKKKKTCTPQDEEMTAKPVTTDETETPASRKSKNKSGKTAQQKKMEKIRRDKATPMDKPKPVKTSKSKRGREASTHTEAAPADIPSLDDLPVRKQKRVVQIMSFMAGFKNMEDDAAQLLMRGRLEDFKACRMNVYWTRGAVGLHMRKERKDFAYFRPLCRSDFKCPPKFQMAAAMKGAEILAPWFLNSGVSNHSPYNCIYNTIYVQFFNLANVECI